MLVQLLLIPVRVDSLLNHIVPSGGTILVDESLNIPGELFVLAVLPHGLDQLLFLGVVELPGRPVHLLETRLGIKREHSLPQSEPVVALEVPCWLLAFSLDLPVQLGGHKDLELIKDIILQGGNYVRIAVPESVQKVELLIIRPGTDHQRGDVPVDLAVTVDLADSLGGLVQDHPQLLLGEDSQILRLLLLHLG